ncbi:MerR family transcriptional regulator [Pseudomonas chlororaphis]|uniref:MerR family transcriptional regulator n=1 Tax=Pseudomonas chlororaphis TaxID=587753 RepID=UPI0009BB0400|nr:MerR family transcriptional regulator [Pseudomonas chlororaphis]
MLKVGELALRAGMTVRTLHHYDSLGLLSPSARSSSGNRLYSEADATRLSRIQLLKQNGHSLGQIKQMLEAGSQPPRTLISQQLDSLAAQQRHIEKLRVRLLRLNQKAGKGTLHLGSDWIGTLEMLVLQEEVLSESEVAALQAIEDRLDNLEPSWEALVSDVQSAITAQVSENSLCARTLAWRWMRLVHLTVGEDAELAFKLTLLQRNSQRAQQLNYIHSDMLDWIMVSFTYARLALFSTYLTSSEHEDLASRQLHHLWQWQPLITLAREHQRNGHDITSPGVRELAQQWRRLFRASHYGDDLELERKVRHAYEREPELSKYTGLNNSLLEFINRALAVI